jgi:UDPglucose 6-dehydrogenase
MPSGDAAPPGERIAVVGCGHVGATVSACLAELGHAVSGIDVDPAIVAGLQAGHVPFTEPDLPELMVANRSAGRLHFTTSVAEGLQGAGYVFLCVNTPATPTGAADLRFVRAAAGQVAEALSGAQSGVILINKSTSPIGTEETIEAILARKLRGAPRPPVVANPEFLREGHAVYDFFHPDRIVVGAQRAEDAEAVLALYQGPRGRLEAPAILTDPRTAEMIKYASNAFLATRVSLINELARLAEPLGVDIDAMVHGVGLDARIGGAFLNAGIGYGGSCLPKDVAALCHTGDSVGVAMRLLSAVQEVNAAQRTHAVNCMRRLLGSLDGLSIAALGATFKGGSEDLRASPALDVIGLLRNEGAYVRLYDPALSPERCAMLADRLCASALDAASGADAVAVLTDWPEFRQLDLPALASVMAGRLLFDGRNLLDRGKVKAAGLQYCGIGRPAAWDAAR